MTAIFQSLVMASFVGTIIWIVQSAIRPVTQKVFTQTWHYYTGLIPVFFLLGGSEIVNRLIPYIRSVSPGTGASRIPGAIAWQHVQGLPMEQTAGIASLIHQPLDALLRMGTTKEIVLAAIVVWAVGAIVFLAVNARTYRDYKRWILQDSRVCDAVHCPVKVIISANATTPLAMGLWKPVVILPDTRFGERELAMIISHELVHIQRGDLLVKLLMLIANAVHWFNPVVYSLNKQMNVLCELSCDEKVIQGMDAEGRRFYGETLLSMLEYGVMQKNIVCTSSLCNPKKIMKRRLIHLMNEKTPKKIMIALSLVAAIALVGSGGAAVYAAAPVAPAKEAPSNREETQKKINEIYVKMNELTDKINSYFFKGLPAPQEYLDAANELNEQLRKLYGSMPPAEEPPVPIVPVQGLSPKQAVASNVYVQSPDGTVEYFDKDGNRTLVPQMKKNITPPVDEETQKKIDELNKKINSYIQKGQPAPQEYLDAVNKLYGFKPFSDK